MEDEYSNAQAIWLVSKYLGKKESYVQLILFHTTYLWNKILELFYYERGLVWIGSRFLEDHEHSNGQVIRLVSKYSGKKEECAQLVIFHPWKIRVEFGWVIKF